jgi:hypothetical protein
MERTRDDGTRHNGLEEMSYQETTARAPYRQEQDTNSLNEGHSRNSLLGDRNRYDKFCMNAP